MDPDVFLPERDGPGLRRAELVYRAGLLALAGVAVPQVLHGLRDVQGVLQRCRTEPNRWLDAMAPCSGLAVVVTVLETAVGLLPVVVFGFTAQRPRRAGQPVGVLFEVLACVLGGFLAQGLLLLLVGVLWVVLA
jgi:hypothetical protein